jgi:hypothetical protein
MKYFIIFIFIIIIKSQNFIQLFSNQNIPYLNLQQGSAQQSGNNFNRVYGSSSQTDYSQNLSTFYNNLNQNFQNGASLSTQPNTQTPSSDQQTSPANNQIPVSSTNSNANYNLNSNEVQFRLSSSVLNNPLFIKFFGNVVYSGSLGGNSLFASGNVSLYH